MQLQMEASVTELVRFSSSTETSGHAWEDISESHEHTSLNTEVVPITRVNYLMSVSQNQVSNPDLRSSNKMNLSLKIWITLIRKGAHTWTHKGRKLNLGQCKKHKLWWKKLKGEQARVRREIQSITQTTLDTHILWEDMITISLDLSLGQEACSYKKKISCYSRHL